MKKLYTHILILLTLIFQYAQVPKSKNMARLLILLILFFPLKSFTQTTFQFSELNKSQGIKHEKRNSFKDGIIVGELGYYLLNVSNYKINLSEDEEKGDYQILHFDKDLKLLQTKNLEISLKTGFPYGGYYNKIESIIPKGESLLIFTLEKIKKEKIKRVIVQAYDAKTLKKQGAPSTVYESIYKGIAKNQGKFGIVQSSDKSKVLIHEMNPLSNSEGKLIGKVLDLNLTPLWEHKVTGKEINNKYLPVNFVAVNDNGDAYFILDKLSSDPQILKFNADGHEEIYISEKNHSKRILSTRVGFDDNQNIVLMGFYSDDNSRNIAGIVKAIDAEGKDDLKATYATFSDDFKKLNTKKGLKSRKVPKTKNYRTKKIISKSNGHWLLIGEEIYAEESSSSTATSPYPYPYNKKWFHKNILIAELDSKGNIVWNKKIAKSGRNGRFDHDVNFFTHQYLDDCLLVYRDNEENMNYPGYGDIKPGGGKQGQISVAHFSKDGKLNFQALYSKEKDDVWDFSPRKMTAISEDELLILFKEKKEYRLVKMKVQ